MRHAAAFLLVLLLAGCAQPDDVRAPTQDPDGSAPALRVVKVADAPGREPTIAATRDGTLFLAGIAATGGAPLYRSHDGGATWAPVADPARGAKVDEDPWVWVDAASDRVFDAPLYIGCTWLAWSDDHGASWDANPAAACPLPGHDHQKLTSGPPPRGIATDGFPSVLYYAYNSLRPGAESLAALDVATEGTAVSTSRDGGKTWSLPVLARGRDACAGGLNGAIAVLPDGTALLPAATCKGVDVLVSRDAGATWPLRRSLDAVGILPPAGGNDPSLVADAEGNAYLAFPGADGATYLATSRDAGATWSAPRRVTPPDVRESIFSVVAAHGGGRVTIAYLGTESDASAWSSRDPSYAPPETVWHLHVATSDDALAAAPAFSDLAWPAPVQRGCVWLHGIENAPPCRNLRDFIGIAARGDTACVAFTDGCDGCTSAQESTKQVVKVATLSRAPSG